ncbi:TPA: YadA-like family protein [Neisseria weaveri]
MESVDMNKNYRSIWNEALGAWVAVSEIETAKGKPNTAGVKTARGVAFQYVLSVLAASLLVVGNSAWAGVELGENVSTYSNCTQNAAGSGAEAVGALAIGGGGGTTTCASSQGSISIGEGSQAKVPYSISIGRKATSPSTGKQTIAIGDWSTVKGDQSIALGSDTNAEGNSSIAIGGDDLDAVATSNAAVINDYTADAPNSNNNTTVAVKYKELTGDYLVNFEDANKGKSGVGKRYSKTTAKHGAVALGVSSYADDLALAIGTRSTANTITSVAIGVGANASKEGAVALGAGSKNDADAANSQSATVGNVTYNNFAGGGATLAGDQVSVGSIGFERQIKNVAAGAVSATSTDAVNGSQLYSVAVSPIKFTGNAGTTNRQLGQELEIKGGLTVDTNTSNRNIYTKVTGADTEGKTKLEILFSDNPQFGKIVVNKGGKNQISGLVAGTDDDHAVNLKQLKDAAWTLKVNGAGNKLIKKDSEVNFENGTGTTAEWGTGNNTVKYSVNKSTLNVATGGNVTAGTQGDAFATAAEVAKAINDSEKTTVVAKGKNVTVDPAVSGNQTTYTVNAESTIVGAATSSDIQVTGGVLDNGTLIRNYQLDLSQTAKEKIQKGVEAKNKVDSDGLIFADDQSQNTDKVKLGETLKLTGDTNIKTSAAGKTVTLKLSKDLNLTDAGSLNVGGHTLNSDGLTISNGTGKAVKLGKNGLDNGGKTITNVASGDISNTSNEAVNGSQVHAISDSLKNILGGSAAVQGNGTLNTNNIGGTGKNTIHEAIEHVNAGWKVHVVQGDGEAAPLAQADQIQPNETLNFEAGKNIKLTQSAGKINIATKDEVAFTSVNVGNGNRIVLDNNGIALGGNTYISDAGLNANNKVIDNVGEGTGDKHAVNFKQLKDASWDLTVNNDANTTKKIKKDTKVNFENGTGTTAEWGANGNTVKYSVNKSQLNVAADGNVTADTAGDTFATAEEVAETVNNSLARKGLYFTDDASQDTNLIKLGEKLNLKGDSNIVTSAAGNTVNFKLAETVTVGGKGVAGNNPITINGKAGNISGLTNKTFDPNSITEGRAATEDQLKVLAEKPLSFAGDYGNPLTRKLGERTNIKGGATVESDLTANNIGVVAEGTDTLTVKLAKNINLTDTGSITIGDSKLNSDGLTIANAVPGKTVKLGKNGLDNGDNKITNVAAGDITDSSKEAVNGSQIHAISNSLKTALGDSFTVGNGGTINAANIGGTNKNTVHEAIAHVNAGWNAKVIQGEGEATALDPSDPIKPTDTLNFEAGKNIKLTQEKGKINIATKDTVSFSSVTAGDPVNTANQVVLNQNGVSFGGRTYIGAAGLNANNQAVTGVADGTADNHAVNLKQLKEAGWNLKVNDANETKIPKDGKVNFANGTGTTAALGNDNTVTYSVNKSTFNINNGTVSAVNGGDHFATAEEVAKAINASEKTTVVAQGKHTRVNGNPVGNVTTYTVDAEKTTVSAKAGGDIEISDGLLDSNTLIADYKVDLTAATKAKIQKGADAKDKVDSEGLIFTDDASKETEKIKLGEKLALNGDKNIVTAATGKQVSFKLANTVTVGEVGGHPVSIDGTQGTVTGLTNTQFNPDAIVSGRAATEDQLQNVARKPLAFAGDYGVEFNRKLGEKVKVVGGAAENTLTENNIGVVTDGTDKLTVKLSKNLHLTDTGSINVGGHTLNSDGLTINNGAAGSPVKLGKSGLDNGGNVINNVASGLQGADIGNIAAGDVKLKNAANIGDLQKINNDLIAKGWKLQTNQGNAEAVRLGDTVQVVDGANTKVSAITTANGVHTYQINVNGLPVAFVNDAGEALVKVGDKYYKAADITADGKLKPGAQEQTPSKTSLVNKEGAPEEMTLDKVKDGKIAAGSKEAVNGGQLHSANQNIANALGGGSQVDQNGNLTKPTYNVYGQTADNVGSAIDKLQQLGPVTYVDNAGAATATPSNRTALRNSNGKIDAPVILGNVASGLENTDLSAIPANDPKLNNAVNVGDLQKISNNLSSRGWKLQTNDRVEANIRLGDTVQVVDGANTNVSVITTANGKHTYQINTDGLPVSFVNRQGDTLVKVGGQYYKAGDINTAGKLADNAQVQTPVKTSLVDGSGTAAPMVLNNVGNGAVSASSKEAVNGSQLHGSNQNVANALGGNSSVDTNGNLVAPTYRVVNGKPNGNAVQDVRNVGDAVTALNTAVTTPLKFAGDHGNAFERKLGSQTNIVGGAAKDRLTENNIGVVSDGTDTLKVQLAKNVDLGTDGSITTGDSTLNSDGLVIKNGTANKPVKLTKDGLDNGGNKIVNVAEGSVAKDSSDAVNGSQLYAANQNIANALGGGSSVDKQGNLTNPTYNVYGEDVRSVGDAVNKLQQRGPVTYVDRHGQPTTTPSNRTALRDEDGNIAKSVILGNVGSGLEGAELNNIADGDKRLNNAVNVGDLKKISHDLTNKGWKVQTNDGREATVKLGDTVQVTDGANTKVSAITTAGDKHTYHIDVVGLPIQYTTKSGKPVAKVGGHFYEVKDDGSPDLAKKIDNPENLVTKIVNPTAQPNSVGGATTLGNIAAATGDLDGTNRGDQAATAINDQTPLGSELRKAYNGLADLNNADETNALTVADAKKQGWVVSADGNNYADDVRHANEVRFSGKDAVTVTGSTDSDGIRNITVSVDAQGIVNKAQIPVVYTTVSGDRVIKQGDKFIKLNPLTGLPIIGDAGIVQPGDVIASMNNAEGKTDVPMSLGNIKSNLPNTDLKTRLSGDKTPVKEQATPKLPSKQQQHAATVGDVLNSGFNLKQDGQARDFVRAYDTVNFVASDSAEIVVSSNETGTSSDIKVNVKTDGKTLRVDPKKGLTAVTTELTATGADADQNGTRDTLAPQFSATDPDALLKAGEIASAVNKLVDEGFAVQTQDGKTVHKKLGEAVAVVGDEGNITTKVQDGKVRIELAKNLTVDSLETGGKGKDGSVSVKDANGNSGINLSAKDGVGLLGLSGKDGANATVSAEKGKATVDPKDEKGIDRISFVSKDPVTGKETPRQVATMDDGLIFAGDTGNTSARKLGETVKVFGGVTEAGKLSDNNIGVVSDGKGNLEVKLAKDIALDSVTIKSPTQNNPDNTVSLTADGLNNGGKVISNVGSGVRNTDAANVGQLRALGNQIHNRIDDLDKGVRGVGANAAALSSVPQVYLPGKSLVAVGLGTYDGASAVAVGFSSISDGGNWIIKANGSANTVGKFSAGVGAGYMW